MLERSVGVEYWSGVESNFGVKKWATLPSIQTNPDHILEKLSFCRCGCEFLSDLIYISGVTTMAQN